MVMRPKVSNLYLYTHPSIQCGVDLCTLKYLFYLHLFRDIFQMQLILGRLFLCKSLK